MSSQLFPHFWKFVVVFCNRIWVAEVFLFLIAVAWFTFEPSLVPQGVRLSNQNLTVTSDSYEPRIILGNIGFSRGVHYWEFVVDKYDASADPSFGIARLDVGKDEMLGNLVVIFSILNLLA